MEPAPRVGGTSRTIEYLDASLNHGGVVIIDADSAALSRPAMFDVLKLLRRSGLIGPARYFLERARAKRTVRGKRPVSAGGFRRVRRGDFVRLMEELAPDLCAASSAAMARVIEGHQARGDFIVVATSAPQELANSLAKEIGAHRGVGTPLGVVDGIYTGEVEMQHSRASACRSLRVAVLDAGIGLDEHGLDAAMFYRSRQR